MAETTDDLEMQWIGRPGPRYQADRNGRKTPPISTGGRLFLQGLDRIVAVNIYNGTILWSREIPYARRFNMPRDCGNWCADDEFIYLAIRDRCWQLDAKTGHVTRHLQTPTSGKPVDWGYIADAGDLLVGSEVLPGASWSDFWGGGGWYDAPEGNATHKIVSRKIFWHGQANRQTDMAAQCWCHLEFDHHIGQRPSLLC